MVTNYILDNRYRRSFLKLFFFALFALLFGAQSSNATHLAGGNITYTCQSGNTYSVKVTIYRDCAGVSLSPPSLTVKGCGQTFNVTYTGAAVTPVLVTVPCNASILTTCNGGTAAGIQRYDYVFNYTLPAALVTCTDVTFSYDVAARNGAINTLTNPGGTNMYLESHLNPLLFPCNNSPTFSIDPILFICANQSYCFNNGAQVNGDSLVYSFISARGAGGVNVTYNPPYDSTHFVTTDPNGPITLNSFTGDICLTPTTTGQISVMAMKVTQYKKNANGAWAVAGSVMRDFQVYIVACTNKLPSLTGVNSTTNYIASVCAGQTLCFKVYSNDVDAADSTKIVVAGGIPPGTFTITPGQRSYGEYCLNTTLADTNKTFTFLLSVRDNACPQNGVQSFTYQIKVTGLTAVINSINPNCFGANNGSATAVPNPAGSYTYLWSPGGQVTQTVTGLTAGSYCVAITNPSGCVLTECVTLPDGPPISAVATSVSPKCFDGTNGTATVTASGTGPFSYVWNTNPAQFTKTATGLGSGTYCVTASNVNGCSVTECATVTIPPPLSATSSSTPASCNGGTDGTATITSVPNGTGPFMYAWSPGSKTGQTISGAAGTYCAVIIDANGCSVSKCEVISQPTPVVVTLANVTDVSCTALGHFDIVATGGVGGYTYVTNTVPPQTGSSVNNVTQGTYMVTVRDANGCRSSQNVVIGGSSAITATGSSTDVLCNAACTGTATITASGSSGYTYAWSPNVSNSNVANGLCAGTYNVIVTAGSCSAPVEIVINQPTAILISETHTNVTCNGDNNGTITVTASGGTGALTYTWVPNVSNSPAAVGLSAGSYIVTVKDANGCSATQTIVITEPTKVAATETHTNVSCNGNNDGTITLTATGGTGAYAYFWNPSVSNTNLANGLSAGTYVVTVRDDNFCTVTKQVVITSPSGINIVENHVDVTCCHGTNGAIILAVSGGTGAYTYNWNPNVSNSAIATGLAVGTYSVIVSDANNCSSSLTVVITKPAPMKVTVDQTNVTCFGGSDGSITLTVTDGKPGYVYVWSPNVSTTNTATGLSAGTYTVTVTDANCCVVTKTIVITEAPQIVLVEYHVNLECCVGATGTIILAVSGGATPYTFNWSPNVSTNATATGLAPGTYSVVVIDANGCSVSTTVEILACPNGGRIVDSRSLTSYLPTSEFAFYPNPATVNATIEFNSSTSTKYSIRIIDLNGREVMYDTAEAFEGVNIHQISLTGVSKGMYMVVFENAGTRLLKKIVVE